MQPTIPEDLFATKGIEYLLVLGFLVALILFWRLLNSPVSEVVRNALAGLSQWFRFPEQLYYHPGHSWARLEQGNVVVVGMDDFAQKLLGPAERINFPPLGARLESGRRGWGLDVSAKNFNLLSPVGGEVIALNDAVLEDPALINQDPYGNGWLLKIRVPSVRQALRQLLHGRKAKGWVEETEAALQRKMSSPTAAVLPDGGSLVTGFARSLDPEKWDEIAREFLMSE
jgi:glycine cleavage system H lipoate-binding protein